MNKAIELRFDSHGTVVRDNRVDAPIASREGKPVIGPGNVRLGDTVGATADAGADQH